MAATETGAAILRKGGAALDAVVAAVRILEDNELFNAGYGSCLTTAGRVEMDAAVMNARRDGSGRRATIEAGGVVLVGRVRNPILLARAVMERTPHVLMGGTGAEQLARQAGVPTRRPSAMISQRARERWLAAAQRHDALARADHHGTVGAVALDQQGSFAAATSTGGVAGKFPGRIGDSAILGAGLFADANGAASATGEGEAILKTALCRAAVASASEGSARIAARAAIRRLFVTTASEAGVVLVDAAGCLGYAHYAASMAIATFETRGGVRYLDVPSIGKGSRGKGR
jgi:beta-aspartyl-peptidase (threonine type)